MKKKILGLVALVLLPVALFLIGCGGQKGHALKIAFDKGSVTAVYKDDGTAVKDKVAEGKEIELSCTMNEGYTFASFLINGSPIEENYFTMPKEDVEVGVNYVLTPYGVIFYDEERLLADKTIAYTIETEDIALEGIEKDGYDFEGWYEEGGEEKVETILQGSHKNYILYANFTPKAYPINYYVYGGSNSLANPSSYTIETESIVLNNPTKNDYEFAGWFDNPNFEGNRIYSINTSDKKEINLYAKFISSKVENGYRVITSKLDFTELILKNPANWSEGKKFKLANDIDLGYYEISSTGIGTSTRPFKAELDGDNHKISFRFRESSARTSQFVGLFDVCQNAIFKNLSVEGYIDVARNTNTTNVAILAAQALNTTFDNCHVVDSVVRVESNTSSLYAGGIAGKGGIFTNCSVTDVTFNVKNGRDCYVGGLSGVAESISGCKVEFLSSGNIDSVQVNRVSSAYEGEYNIVFGGLTGMIENGIIENSYLYSLYSISIGSGVASSYLYAGGLVGIARNSQISTSFAYFAQIVADAGSTANGCNVYAGGIVGSSNGGSITKCFVDYCEDLGFADSNLKFNIYLRTKIVKASVRKVGLISAFEGENTTEITDCYAMSPFKFYTCDGATITENLTTKLVDLSFVSIEEKSVVLGKINDLFDSSVWNLSAGRKPFLNWEI